MATDQPQVWNLTPAPRRQPLTAFVYAKAQAAAELREDSSIYCRELTVDLNRPATSRFSLWFDSTQPYWICSSGSHHWIQIQGSTISIEPINDPPDPRHTWIVQILATDDEFLVGVLCITPTP